MRFTTWTLVAVFSVHLLAGCATDGPSYDFSGKPLFDGQLPEDDRVICEKFKAASGHNRGKEGDAVYKVIAHLLFDARITRNKLIALIGKPNRTESSADGTYMLHYALAPFDYGRLPDEANWAMGRLRYEFTVRLRNGVVFQVGQSIYRDGIRH